jgi:hypothetical protein
VLRPKREDNLRAGPFFAHAVVADDHVGAL